MKNASFKYHLCVILAVLSYLSTQAQVEKPPCTFDQYFIDHPDEYERAYIKNMERYERLNNNTAQYREDEIYTIPVVFHILYFHPSENVSDGQIMTQLAVLNQDFNQLNTNQDIVPSLFDTLIANVGIEFCLAKKDPSGNNTSGINRIQRSTDDYLTVTDGGTHPVFYTDLGGLDAWPTDRYLNIWVTKIASGALAFVPQPLGANPDEDGIVIAPRAIGCGVIGEEDFTHLGRTLTHEIGHYLNLQHLEHGPVCDPINDFIPDTPTQLSDYSGCPDFPSRTCGSIDMTMNFMQWSDDACLAMFTPDQKNWMRNYLQTDRDSLHNPDNCQPPISNGDLSDDFTVYPNPTSTCIHILSEVIAPVGEMVTVSLHDMSGRTVYSALNRIESIQPIEALHLANGMYILKLRINKKVLAKKVLVLK